YIEGVGYSTIQDILTGALQGVAFLVLLFALKLFATALTIGSGGSGGIFSPSLFMGAALGGAYGIMLNHAIPAFDISPPAFAIVGMAGVVGGATGAALTAIVMILEMTLDYNVVIPLTITVAISFGVRRLLCRESIYTLKLVRRGHYVPEALYSNVQNLKRAGDIMDTDFLVLPATTAVPEFRKTVRQMPEMHWYILEESGGVAAVLSREQALETVFLSDETVAAAEAGHHAWIVAGEETPLYDVLAHLSIANARLAMVMRGESVSAEDVVGIIGYEQIAGGIQETAELFSG
ncbi:MAG TPA: chloride channel protein, partial [Geobacteraceae bacterium]